MGNSFFDNIGNAFDEIGRNVNKTTNEVANNVGKVAGEVGSNITHMAGEVSQNVGRIAGEVGQGVSNFANEKGRDISDIATNAAHNVAKTAGDVGHGIAEFAGKVGDNVNKALDPEQEKMEQANAEMQRALDETNTQIERLGACDNVLFDHLNEIQTCFDAIRNVPTEQRLQYEELAKIRLDWKKKAEEIQEDCEVAAVKAAGAGAAGAAAGIGVAALAPTVAMGIATTFGVASTGTAISALSGAAATHAALAWLGGGALVAGGGGMAAGNAFLAMCSPIGWTIAGVALLTSGLLIFKNINDKKRLEKVFTLISERDTKKYQLATVELKERIVRIDDENDRLAAAIERVKSFGLDYEQMSEAQQYELGSYVNLMGASTQLLINPILGLQTKVTETDLSKFALSVNTHLDKKHTEAIVYLANLLYKIDIDDTDRKLLCTSFSRNEEFLQSVNLDKKDFDLSMFETVTKLLMWTYGNNAAKDR